MTAIDFTQVQLKKLVTHRVGNKLLEENIKLSEEETTLEEATEEYLLKYFLQPFKPEDFYSFTHPVNLELNEVHSIVQSIFSKKGNFIKHSQNIAKLLYEYSMHPKIKEGDLNIAQFSSITLGNEIVDAIGIFKSESDVPFIKMKGTKSNFVIKHELGYELKGIDKACIIFNTNENEGFKLLIFDANKSNEAQYWRDEFLKVKHVQDEFHQTNQFLGIAKNFVTKQLSEEFEVSKADKIDLLNRSVNYFKSHDTFDKEDFEQEVFQDKNIIKSFQNFDSTYRADNDIELEENFDISPQAVKKQAKVFKSVLKLDKNFHIYIHGDRELIEQGVEKDGRKYYKIYFEKEM